LEALLCWNLCGLGLVVLTLELVDVWAAVVAQHKLCCKHVWCGCSAGVVFVGRAAARGERRGYWPFRDKGEGPMLFHYFASTMLCFPSAFLQVNK